MNDLRKWDSSLIKISEYDSIKKELIIEFGNGARYLYQEFPEDLYNDFLKAKSKGEFFHKKIKTHETHKNVRKL